MYAFVCGMFEYSESMVTSCNRMQFIVLDIYHIPQWTTPTKNNSKHYYTSTLYNIIHWNFNDFGFGKQFP